MTCIGDDRLACELIRKKGTFSANVIAWELLSVAGCCGTHTGCKFGKAAAMPPHNGDELYMTVPGQWTLELPVCAPSASVAKVIFITAISMCRPACGSRMAKPPSKKSWRSP